MAEIILVDASIEVESPTFNGTITVSGDTITITEGQGESSVETATNAGQPVIVISEDVKTKVGKVKFEMPASIASMEASRSIKAAPLGTIVLRLSGSDSAGNRFGRTLRQGTMTSDPEKAIQNGGKVPIEVMGFPLVPS